MIRYTLKCAQSHDFDSWFADAAGYETLKSSNQISCPICGNTSVEKALMAPAVRLGRKSASPKELDQTPALGSDQTNSGALSTDLQTPNSELEVAFANLRRHIETNSEYVGDNFAKEARKMHEGDAPERSIYGETKPEEARKLIDEGIAITPLPFMSSRKAN